MKEKPILFSTPMIKAILAGNKTQTRRIIKHFGNEYHYETLLCDWGLSGYPQLVNNNIWEWTLQTAIDDNQTFKFKCPFGQIDDILWVRETWALPVDNEGNDIGYQYKSDYDDKSNWWKWKPSIFMPKEACRIKLKITDIRVERIQDISENDAIAEGIIMNNSPHPGWYWMEDIYMTDSPTYAYELLWKHINGKESWESNIWIWVLQFEKI